MSEEQRSQEWFEARLGKVTASKISDLTARTKTGYSASRDNYMAQLIVERLTQLPQESYTNAAMQWGLDTEPQARAAYEMQTGNSVSEVGFIIHPKIADSGASPDGLIGNDGLVEIKCPNSATHIEFLLSPTIEKKYMSQMQWQMACTGRQWCDFASFDPRLPLNLQLKIVRVVRDEVFIGNTETEVIEFLAEVERRVAALKEMEEQYG